LLNVYLLKIDMSNFQAISDQYHSQINQPNSESKPFDSFYAGRVSLEAALTNDPSLTPVDRVRLTSLLGRNYEHCEEPHKASDLMLDALKLFLAIPVSERYTTLDSIDSIASLLNDLSSLWCSRGDGKKGLHFALLAKRVIDTHKSEVSAFAEIGNTFQLARSLGSIHRPDLASVLCCQTLDLQLRYNLEGASSEDDPWLNCCNREWMRRCADLAVYFVNEGLFWSAEYLLHCSLALTDLDPNDMLRAEVLRDLGKFYSSRMTFVRHCKEAKTPREALDAWKSITRGKEIAGASLGAFTLELEAEFDEVIPKTVELNPADFVLAVEVFGDGVCLSDKLKVRLPVLIKSVHDRAVARMVKINQPLTQLYLTRSNPVPALSACGSGEFDSVKEIFKLGLHFSLQALEIFKLDSFATDHLEVSMEVAGLYECVQEWEKDVSRIAAILKRRAAILEPLMSSVNQKVFLSFSRNASYTLGVIFSQLFNIKDEDKYIDKSVYYFQQHCDSFLSPSQQPPLPPTVDVVEDDSACYTLARAHLNIGRLEMKRKASTSVEGQYQSGTRSIACFYWFIDFVKRHACLANEPTMAENVQVCRDSIRMVSVSLHKLTQLVYQCFFIKSPDDRARTREGFEECRPGR